MRPCSYSIRSELYRLLTVILVALSMTANLSQAADAKNFKLKVVDEQGQPVTRFEAMVYSGTGLHWAAGTDGNVSLTTEQVPPVARIIVRADGYASTTKQFSGDQREKMLRGEQSMSLARGAEVKLQFHLPAGMIWPNGALPELYFDNWKEVAQSARSADGRKWYESRNAGKPVDLNMLNFHPDAAGNFVFRVAPNTPPFSVGINIPGFLQYFDEGPLTAANFKNGLLQIDVPQPGNLEVALHLGSTPPDKLQFKAVRYQVFYQGRAGTSFSEVADETVSPDSKPLQLNDVPSGSYVVSVFTLPARDMTPFFGEEADPHRFRDRKQVLLGAGKTEKIDFNYVPLDPQAFHGQRTAILRVETADGKPAVGREVSIDFYAEHYGVLPVFSGKVPDAGEISLSDISDAKPADGSARDLYMVRIGKERAGGFGFKTNDPTEHFTFRCPPLAGDMAPEVKLLNVTDGKTIKLSDLRGKLVVLDFWATWCGPCQPALEKLDQLVADKSAAWKDRVAVVPVSIDDESEQAKKHLIDRGWTHFNPYWTGSVGKLGFDASAMQAFVVNGVPCTFLIDPAGKILWRGHPMGKDGGKTLEESIDAALNPPAASNESPASKASEDKQSSL